MNSKKLLALLLAATLLTGSLCGPVFAARAGQTAGAESLEEIPPETIFTEKTDASAEGEATRQQKERMPESIRLLWRRPQKSLPGQRIRKLLMLLWIDLWTNLRSR